LRPMSDCSPDRTAGRACSRARCRSGAGLALADYRNLFRPMAERHDIEGGWAGKAGLARRPQCCLSGRRADDRCAPCGRRRVGTDLQAKTRSSDRDRLGFRSSGESARSFRLACRIRRQPGRRSFRISPGYERAPLSLQGCQVLWVPAMSPARSPSPGESAPATRSAIRVVCAPETAAKDRKQNDR
jgi:hypothetical protein